MHMIRKLFFAAAFAVLFVLTGCNKPGDQDWTGMEYITFDVKGRVTDAAGNALEGIGVKTVYGEEVFTDASGFFQVSGSCKPLTVVNVECVDRDGEANGVFMKTVKKVNLEFVGGAHGPYQGKYEATGVVIVMQIEAEITPGNPEVM